MAFKRQSFKELFFRFTLSKFDVFEGFLVSYFSFLSGCHILGSDYFQNQNAVSVLYMFFQASLIGVLVLAFLLITKKVKKNLDIAQFFAVLLVPYLSMVFIYGVALSYKPGGFDFSDYLYFFILLALFLRSSGIFICYFLMALRDNEVGFSIDWFFKSKYLKTVAEATNKEKNIFIMLILFLLSNYFYFSSHDRFLAAPQAFYKTIAIFELWVLVKSLVVKANKIILISK